jgi:DNA ligase (NAD+)
MTTEILPPSICPDCQGPVTPHVEAKSQIETHWCTNDECPGRIADMLEFVGKREQLEIEGLGPEMCAALAKGKYVVTLADLFEYCNEAKIALDRVGPERFAAGMNKKGLGGADTIKMIETAERAKSAPWPKWLASLGIPSIGVVLATVLAKELNLNHADFPTLPYKILVGLGLTIEGIGIHKKAELKAFAESSRSIELCRRLHAAGVRPMPIEVPKVAEGAPLAGLTFCITGEMYHLGSREGLIKQLESLGAVSKSGVTKKCQLLIVGSEPGQTKLKKATELSIRMVDADWVEETFKKHGISTGSSMDWADEL